MNTLVSLLQCSAFILVPLITFGVGIWCILKLDNKFRFVSLAWLIGFIFFEGSLIGMILDPRLKIIEGNEIVLNAIGIGVATFLCVLVFTPIARSIWHTFE